MVHTFSIKSYVLAINCGGDSNISPHVILWRTSGIYAKSSFYTIINSKNSCYGQSDKFDEYK